MKVKSLIPTVLLVSFFAGAVISLSELPPAHAEMTLFEKSRTESFAMLGEVPRPKPGFRMGVVLVTLANPYWVSMKDGYENAARDFNITIDIQAAPQENSTTAQLNILENMVAKEYDVIAAHTITAHNLIPGLVKAQEKGIIVVTGKRVDLKAAREAGANPIAVGLVDYYAQGKIGAEYIAKELAKNGGGKVAIIEGLPGAPQSKGRKEGAIEGFKSEPSIEIVSIQPANWDRKKAYDVKEIPRPAPGPPRPQRHHVRQRHNGPCCSRSHRQRWKNRTGHGGRHRSDRPGQGSHRPGASGLFRGLQSVRDR